ncbi:chitobiase/beta-hexosaminidase C-terminal domain-containing protein [Peribacillus loiseleuriae]|uniref:chitobiase/beta-hexosaminidase C-terminal domain-containing protein n=1 Tax=Peribacillus loiseleuriae TaxID=1679170 RepID=UPI00067158F3|nr:chitobiase/beta-hexosaminidase C-terminal domain-containing protein [Peribacillus loiseleuriae]
MLVIKDYFEGSSNVIKSYQEDMIGFKIANDHDTTKLTFTINGITILVKALETFSGRFAPFKSITINTTVPYRATVLAPFDGTITPPPPNEVTNLSASNVKATTLTLSWTASHSNDVVAYDIYMNGTFLTSVANTSYEVTGLTPLTAYTFSVYAKDGANHISSGTDLTITTLETVIKDTTPPVLTITPGGTFTDTQTVTMTTNETATIYYTLDGTNPTSSSPIYSAPLTLTDTATIKAFAKDLAGNECVIQTVSYTKKIIKPTAGIITDGLILHYDFTNRAKTTSNTIVDKVNNVVATLVGVAHNGTTDGYVDNKGLLLQKQGYVQIPTNTSPLNQLIDLNGGLTIQMISYDTNGVHWKTEDGKFTAAKSDTFIRYKRSDESEGTKGFNSYWFIDATGYKQSYADFVNPIGSNAINIFTLRVNSENTVNLFINDAINENGRIPVPNDFASFNNTMAKSPLQLRRDYTVLNSSPETLVAFIIYNRTLTDDEVRSNYHYYRNEESLVGISTNPSVVKLNAGESQFLSVQALPNRYTDLLNITFQSGNEGYVTVDENGVLSGVADGETNISITATFQNQTFTEYVNVKVGGQVATPPTSTRVIDGMSINRKTDSIKVGENFVVMATALSSSLPYDIFNDNIVLWESSNPSIAKVQYGVVEGVAEGHATLTAFDATRTYSKSFDLTVVKPPEDAITPGETYYVPLNGYSIKSNNADSQNTTNGIQRALDYASANRYKKIIFPYGTYLISPAVRTIYPPTEMTIDFSDSILNIEPSKLTTTGYKMFYFNNVTHTKLVRAHVYGERDSTTVQASVEGCITVLMEDCLHTGVESCTFSKSPGFNFITGTRRNMNMGTPTKSISISKFNFELGNIDKNGNIDNSVTANYYRYNQYMDISGLGEYYLVGYTQGYHGYPYLRSRLYSMYFYDENYHFIEAQMFNLQFYNYDKPANAKYAKMVIYQEAPPTSGDTDFGGAVAFMRTFGMPRNGFIKNCTFEDNFSTGLAMCGGQGWFIENNTFSNNRGRMPGCDIDWEDGWEHMVGDVLKHNTFNSPIGVIFSAGGSLAACNNTFNRSALTVWGRTQNWRVFNNMFNQKAGATSPSLSTQGDSVFARNILKGLPPFTPGIQHPDAKYKVHTIDNTFIN